MLADEPVASLDPATADKVMTLLHRICKEDGISAVVSLHQVDLAKRYADRIVGLAQGRVVFDAAPDALTATNVAELYQARDPGIERDTRSKGIPLVPAVSS
jgi:phosphonate transport system ATP-binding protein